MKGNTEINCEMRMVNGHYDITHTGSYVIGLRFFFCPQSGRYISCTFV